jgi:serine/threonine-protein kinase
VSRGAEPERFGKYRVLRRIASGGMSEVYLCLLPGEEGFRKRVAVKAVHPRHAGDPRFRGLFIREARLSASLSHPNLIQVFDFGREGSAYFLAMEFVEGWSLAEAAAQARRLGLAVPPGIWRHWVEGILSGLMYLHGRGILHRDVSPGNVLLGRTGAVKLADFGVSRAAAMLDEAGDLLAGKAAYFSPERARGEAATPSSDLFAAATISAELLLGRRLFDGGATEEVLGRIRAFDADALPFPGTADGVASIVRKGLAADPARRFEGAGDFLEALAAHGPERGSPAEQAAFWHALFPEADEEATAPSIAAGTDPGPWMVKESPPRYGTGGRKLAAGAAALFALAAGGAYLWVEKNVPGPRASGPPATAAKAEPSPASLPSAAGRDVVLPPDAADASPAGGREVSPAAAPVPPMQRLVRIETDPAGADILLENGETVGRTPARIDLSSLGGRGIVLVREGFERKRVPSSALAKVDTLRTELDPVLGTVEAIQAIPWARVYVGSRFLGDTPLTDIRLPAGEHRLRFVNEPLGVDKSQVVAVRPGKNPKVIVRMTGDGE